jgi:hypothetical protein
VVLVDLRDVEQLVHEGSPLRVGRSLPERSNVDIGEMRGDLLEAHVPVAACRHADCIIS